MLGAWNAVGCVFGALLTSHLLIPHLGSERTLAGLAVLCAAGGLGAAVVLENGEAS